MVFGLLGLLKIQVEKKLILDPNFDVAIKEHYPNSFGSLKKEEDKLVKLGKLSGDRKGLSNQSQS